MSENKNGAGFYTGLFLGSIAGLTMGILFAPKSGEETRSIISDKTSDWKEKDGRGGCNVDQDEWSAAEPLHVFILPWGRLQNLWRRPQSWERLEH